MAPDDPTSSPGQGEAIAKTAATTLAGLAAGAVLLGPVGAVVIGGVAGWFSYQRWLASRQDHASNKSPPSG